MKKLKKNILVSLFLALTLHIPIFAKKDKVTISSTSGAFYSIQICSNDEEYCLTLNCSGDLSGIEPHDLINYFWYGNVAESYDSQEIAFFLKYINKKEVCLNLELPSNSKKRQIILSQSQATSVIIFKHLLFNFKKYIVK